MKWSQITKTEDISKLVEFEQKVHLKRDWVTINEYIFWLKRGLKIFTLKNDQDELIGIYQVLNNPDEIIFHGFAVHSDYQRKGFGQKLMDRMVNEYSYKNITCKTRPDNYIMKNLLSKNGFINKLDEIMDGGEYWTWWTRPAESQEL